MHVRGSGSQRVASASGVFNESIGAIFLADYTTTGDMRC